MGLCPLHADRKPSLLVDPGKSLFYCFGCGRGGDVIRFVELFHGVRFGEALAVLRRWSGVGSLLSDAVHFYQLQLQRHPEAFAYLAQRGVHQPELVERMRIGYAPGRCLGAHLMHMGYSRRDLQQAGVFLIGPRSGSSCSGRTRCSWRQREPSAGGVLHSPPWPSGSHEYQASGGAVIRRRADG